MNAAEFIAKFGWEEASEVVTGLPEKFKPKDLSLICYDNNTYKYSDRFSPRRSLVNMSDLKNHINAWELIKDHYGLTRAKEYAESAYTAPEIAEPLKKAIALVEEVESFKEVC